MVCSSGASHVELFPGEVVSREAFYRSSCHKYPTTVSLPLFISLYLSLSGLQQQIRPVRRGGSLGSYEPPSGTCGKQKSEPNHFAVVQELIEESELEASLKSLEVPHCPPFCYDVIG